MDGPAELPFSHDGNLGGSSVVEQTLILPAGNYTLNIAGNKGGAFDPVGLRDGFTATLTTVAVPEPSSLLLVGLGTIGSLGKRKR
ncbi:MAG: PEP-CTERM sorting domain-containing protein [Verrucomicrobiales bacterium]